MEEKDRFRPRFENCIEDNTTQITYCVNHRFVICDLLNQQDKRIKEFESRHSLSESEYQHYCSFKCIEPEIRGCLDREKALERENQQLKHQLYDLPKKIVEEIKNELGTSKLKLRIVGIDGYSYTSSFLDTILKKYGGENE